MNVINNYSKHYNQYYALLASRRTRGLWPAVLLEMGSLRGTQTCLVLRAGEVAAVGWGTRGRPCSLQGCEGIVQLMIQCFS